MANFVATQFPNYHFVLESTGEQRMDFLNRLASLYNDMKSKGYPVLGATIVGEDETAHIELETKNGDTLTGLIDKGAIDSSRAKDVFGRILQTVREINQKEGKNLLERPLRRQRGPVLFHQPGPQHRSLQDTDRAQDQSGIRRRTQDPERRRRREETPVNQSHTYRFCLSRDVDRGTPQPETRTSSRVHEFTSS